MQSRESLVGARSYATHGSPIIGDNSLFLFRRFLRTLYAEAYRLYVQTLVCCAFLRLPWLCGERRIRTLVTNFVGSCAPGLVSSTFGHSVISPVGVQKYSLLSLARKEMLTIRIIMNCRLGRCINYQYYAREYPELLAATTGFEPMTSGPLRPGELPSCSTLLNRFLHNEKEHMVKNHVAALYLCSCQGQD